MGPGTDPFEDAAIPTTAPQLQPPEEIPMSQPPQFQQQQQQQQQQQTPTVPNTAYAMPPSYAYPINPTPPYYNSPAPPPQNPYFNSYQYAPTTTPRSMAMFNPNPNPNDSAATGQQTPTMLLQDAMSRFARVSSMIDDVLRHLHMLFDATFGLAYAIGAFRAETGLWLSVKYGPVVGATKVLRALTSTWRLVALFLMSPMAGRFSPVAIVLRILGLVPEQARAARSEEETRIQGQAEREEEEEEDGDLESGAHQEGTDGENSGQGDADGDNGRFGYGQDVNGYSFM